MHDYDSGGGDGDGMTELLEWVKRMIFLGIFLTILLQVLPNGTYRKYVRFFAGMYFLKEFLDLMLLEIFINGCLNNQAM